MIPSKKFIIPVIFLLLAFFVYASVTTHTNVFIRESATINQTLEVGDNVTINDTLITDSIEPRTGTEVDFGIYNATGGFVGSLWGSLVNSTSGVFTSITQNGNIVFDHNGGINAANITAGTFGAGDYVFPNELNATIALRGMNHFGVETVNITCFSESCDFYMNASSGCTHYPNNFEVCGS